MKLTHEQRVPSRDDLARLSRTAERLRAQGHYDEAASLFGRIAQRLPDRWVAQYNAGAAALEAGRNDDAAEAFARAVALAPGAQTFSMQGHALALCGRMRESQQAYRAAVACDARYDDAHWGLFEVEQLLGEPESALDHQRRALALRSLRTIPARRSPARTTILELCIAGSFQANIPLDFILDLDGTTVHKLYVGEHPIPPLPPYDLVFNTIADAPNAGPALDAAARFIAGQDRPALNAPALVPRTSRDAVAARFASSSTVMVAPTVRRSRADVERDHPAFPFLIRPLDSHAGNGLAKIDDAAGLAAYLAAAPDVDAFYACDFIDYRNADGLYRKYRVIFVDGEPYPIHLAISPRWMIHYYNASMAEHAWMRDEEHAFLRDLDRVFEGRARAGLREVARAIPLDYFGIDCSIAPDGRLLVFEASTAMIVHLRDPIDLYPYKRQYVPRMIRALEALMDRRLGRAPVA